MDIYEYITKDHQKVAQLFQLYETSHSKKQRIEVFKLIKKELTLHSSAEEAVFYNTIEHNTKDAELIHHSKKEHEQITTLLSEISQSTSDVARQKKTKKLKEIVEHHVKEEESRIFDEAKKLFNDKEAQILKEKMHDYKAEMLQATEM